MPKTRNIRHKDKRPRTQSPPIDPILFPSLCPKPTPTQRHQRPLPKKTRHIPSLDPLLNETVTPAEAIASSSRLDSESSRLHDPVLPIHPTPNLSLTNETTFLPPSTIWRTPPYDFYSTWPQSNLRSSASKEENSSGSEVVPENSDTDWTQTQLYLLQNPNLVPLLTPYPPPPPIPMYHPMTADPQLTYQHMPSTDLPLLCPADDLMNPLLPNHSPQDRDRTPTQTQYPPFRTSLDCSTIGSQTQSTRPVLSAPSPPAPMNVSDPMLTDTLRLQPGYDVNEQYYGNWTTKPMNANDSWGLWTGIDDPLQPPLSDYEPKATSFPMSYLPNAPNPPILSPLPTHLTTRLPLPPIITDKAELPSHSHSPFEFSPPRHLTDLPVTPSQAEWEAAFKFLNPDFIMTTPITTPPTTMETALRIHRLRRSVVPRRNARSLPPQLDVTRGKGVGNAEATTM